MDFKINRETVHASECIYEGVQEQGIELDYILPDYYPDIFRLVRCEVTPTVTDYLVSGDKLSYELRCDIKILYCGESGETLQCVSRRQTFSKTADIGRMCENAAVRLQPKTDYINYRAVNKRRLDVRGAVSVRISVEGEKNHEVISDVFGMHMQIRKTPVRFAVKKINVVKNVQITEDTEISAAQPPVISIINCRCSVSDCDKKMVSGKLLAKGEADIRILYSCEKDGTSSLETMAFVIPYSQIVDMDGMDESYECSVSAEVVGCDITPTADKNGENRIIRCELEIRLGCNAVKTAEIMLGTDAYSTVYPCETFSSEIRAEQLPVTYTETFRHNAKICDGDNVPQTVYSMWCTPRNINTRIAEDGRHLIISGMLTYTMAAKDSAGIIVMPDKDEAFEETTELDGYCPDGSVSVDVCVSGVSYNISSDGVLTAKADISAKISVYSAAVINALTDISVDSSIKKERDGDYSIKLYYGVENEEIWDIAKRYSTDAAAIMEENDLVGERLENGGMLLIPIIN
jgi:hypothetical protein